ncbi:MAG: ABC transporter ATP-binding protein [Bdellovibrionota bacterium]
MTLRSKKVCYNTDRYEVVFDHVFQQGKKYFIHTRNFSSETIFLDLLTGISSPHKGEIQYGGLSFKELSRFELRDHIYVIDKPTVIHGTVEENLSLGMYKPSQSNINEALELVELSVIDSNLPAGALTSLKSSGYPLWPSQLIRLEVARALLQKPKILVLTNAFDQLDKQRRGKIIRKFFEQDCTLLIFSYFPIKDIVFDQYLSMDRGKLVKHGSFQEMSAHAKSESQHDVI